MTNKEIISAIEKRIREADPAWDFAPVLKEALKALLLASEQVECGKKWEYSVHPPEVNGVFKYRAGAELKAFMLKHAGHGDGTIIRRQVGEWEEVPNEP